MNKILTIQELASSAHQKKHTDRQTDRQSPPQRHPHHHHHHLKAHFLYSEWLRACASIKVSRSVFSPSLYFLIYATFLYSGVQKMSRFVKILCQFFSPPQYLLKCTMYMRKQWTGLVKWKCEISFRCNLAWKVHIDDKPYNRISSTWHIIKQVSKLTQFHIMRRVCFHGFLHSLQPDSRTVPHMKWWPFPFTSFIIHFSLSILLFGTV
jgi:hypothetical protein